MSAALIFPAQAQLDTNNNGMSDVWERHFNNGELFDASNPGHHPDADPDGDGWTNLQESVAGTDPFSGNPPDGMVAVHVSYIHASDDPESFDQVIVTWDTLPGKQYTLKVSPDLTADSWTPVDTPLYGDGQPAAINITFTDTEGVPPQRLFWRVHISDLDSDGDGLTDYEEYMLGLNPFAAETHPGIPDLWVATHFPDSTAGFDPHHAPFPNGLTYQDMHDLGMDPAEDVDIGPVNLGINEDILHFPVLSFRDENPADLYHQDGIHGWQADTDDHIEVWDEGDGIPYFELQAHLGSHGVKQEFNLLPGSQLALILRYKGRYSYYHPYDNAFTLKVEGATSLTVNGSVVPPSGGVSERLFMDDDDWEKYTDWHFASVVIQADPDATTLVPVTLSLVPVDTGMSNQEEITRGGFVGLIPVELAPEVIAVNSNFDEGRIDPATGYAIPDCDDIPGVCPVTGAGNTEMALEADRDHLDGEYTQYERITNNLHKGWFGVHPKAFSDEFWQDATVTIKKIGKIDSDTGHPESGQVRFYAKWGDGPSEYRGIPTYDPGTLLAADLVTGGINKVPGESVYGSNSIIPENAVFYMEGIRPGKITLEWSYKKGDVELSYEQTFLVETRQSVAEWQEEVRYQIRLQTMDKTGNEVDVALYHPGNGFRTISGSQPVEHDNVLRVQAIYYYYQQLFNQMPEKFMWAGMAKTAAAPIYAGMSDLTTLWQVQEAAGGYGAGTYFLTRGLLCGGQKIIFEDKAWAHRAYIASGIWALNWVEIDENEATDFEAWRSLEVGIFNENQAQINAANRDFLLREQRDVVQDYYSQFATSIWMHQPKTGVNWINASLSWLLNFEIVVEEPGLGANVGEWLSANAKKNPIPGGPAFRDTVPGGRIDNYEQRWHWTNNNASGMLQIWTGTADQGPNFTSTKRTEENSKTMYSAAAAYSFDVGGLPVE